MRLQTQGKIECWHHTLKNRIFLKNDFLPGDIDAQIEAFVESTTISVTTKRCPT